MSLEYFHKLDAAAAMKKLLECCHSQRWADAVAKGRPYESLGNLQDFSDRIWFGLSESDWLEAFAGHPKIGDVNSLRAKYANTKNLASNEQSGVAGAEGKVLLDLARLNHEYERKHGFIFIVFATGKTAAEMLHLLEQRIGNPRPLEFKNAAQEQSKITRLRLEKIL